MTAEANCNRFNSGINLRNASRSARIWKEWTGESNPLSNKGMDHSKSACPYWQQRGGGLAFGNMYWWERVTPANKKCPLSLCVCTYEREGEGERDCFMYSLRSKEEVLMGSQFKTDTPWICFSLFILFLNYDSTSPTIPIYWRALGGLPLQKNKMKKKIFTNLTVI